MKEIRFGSWLIMVFGAMVVLGISCTNYTIPGRGSSGGPSSCEECHTDYARLKDVYSPDDTASALNGFGEINHIKPYDRVFLGGDGFESFKTTTHYTLGCTGCHNGDGKSDSKEEAHSGTFLKHPSDSYDQKCGSCHEQITGYFATSLHQGTGMKRKVALRSGLSGASEFDQLPAHQIAGYNNNCAQCHGSCGDCHVVRPVAGGGGLAKGHEFRMPDPMEVCITCHANGEGHAFLGTAEGTEPDLHYSEADFDCLSCHDGLELHGNGEPVEQRYAYTELPQCEDCHSGIKNENVYHSIHYGDFDCYICHSQDYNNCGSCHIDGEGLRVEAYLGFKIARNPLPGLRGDFDYALVRRTPASPDNWEVYDVDEYSSFDVLPTYSYATPHNLQRWTSRTQTSDGTCNSSCHIRMENDSMINKELFLFQSDLLQSELEANANITMDGHVPSSWTK